MTEIISRSEAKAAKLMRYFTGKACCRRHIAERFVRDGMCVQCYNDSKRSRYAANPEKALERSRVRYEANPEPKLALGREWRKKNHEKQLKLQRDWCMANPEKVQAAHSKHRAKKYCAELSARIDRGLESTKASGAFLDLDAAIDLFKAHGNAFEFLETGDHAPQIPPRP